MHAKAISAKRASVLHTIMLPGGLRQRLGSLTAQLVAAQIPFACVHVRRSVCAHLNARHSLGHELVSGVTHIIQGP